MRRINVAELRQNLADVLNRAAYQGERFIIHRREKNAAAIIPVEDLELLERLVREEEDRIDLAATAAALAEGDYVPYEQFRAEMGLTDESRDRPVPHPDRRRRAAAPRKAGPE
jgi:prevent-host-death family protein